ncbi:hypothetical protein CEXT_440301 [Caerostris extrusa]|uniref:Uncharacterized protein n=1 Tax=Caerostris extrusa TaxID=172846 RepID=A0AAV4UJF6_CAEEX|nr:hypothetical protein CEXT_440301 [Caerostris extrusa]
MNSVEKLSDQPKTENAAFRVAIFSLNLTALPICCFLLAAAETLFWKLSPVRNRLLCLLRTFKFNIPRFSGRNVRERKDASARELEAHHSDALFSPAGKIRNQKH